MYFNDKVIDVKDGKDIEGEEIVIGDYKNGTDSQGWRILYVDQKGADRTKGFNKKFGMKIGLSDPFFLQSRLPMKRVLSTPNASSVRINTLHEQRTDKKQQWWFDEKTKTIRSNNWKNYALSMSGSSLNMAVQNSRWF
jgi:hypothetical protein